jgi:hypothetical protein
LLAEEGSFLAKSERHSEQREESRVLTLPRQTLTIRVTVTREIPRSARNDVQQDEKGQASLGFVEPVQ